MIEAMMIESTLHRRPWHRHAASGTSTYKAWANMIQRCTNQKHPAWINYGGRGIKVCTRWLSFTNFLADMGEKPSPDLSLDRINNNGDYEPENCRWVTTDVQAKNKRYVSRASAYERGYADGYKAALAEFKAAPTRP